MGLVQSVTAQQDRQPSAARAWAARLLHPEWPFSPAAFPLYYGWVIAGMACLMLLASIPGQTAGFAVFTESIVSDSGLSRMTLSTAYALGTAVSALALPRAGSLSDRMGARLAAVLAVLALALGLLLLSTVPALGDALPPWALIVGLVMAFSLTRFGGAGWLMLLASTLIGRWFGRRRGLVSGLFSALTSVVFAASPALLLPLVREQGWRTSLLWLALGVLAVAGLFWAFVRNAPEACGLTLEGSTQAKTATDSAQPPSGMTGLDREAVLKTASFWLIGCGGALYVLVMTGLSFHLIDVGATLGLTQRQSTALFIPIAVTSTIGGIGVSILAARLPIALTLGFFFVAIGLGSVGTALGAYGYSPAWMIAGLGLAGATFSPFSMVLLPRAFGRLHLGAIQGTYFLLIALASALAPPAFALARRTGPNYNAVLVMCSGLAACGLAIVITLRHRINRRGQTTYTG